ncbi:cytochrome c oxidase assembly protein [Paenibacillus agricola]|uniref:Cytochrome c oxidase assembly protein n=1 Tax=Paenibacillus agricola TaxID=2716264 RepID=A0ABX0JCL2_9BACL|nr:cytochrome c oxidase assembly protein [Paenibacillus agricola]NHN33303.1 cytochrome c oxidase assembly protein [Paenibacillus agricola]
MLQKVFFMFGLIAFYLAEGIPLNLLANEFMFSAHMLQQSLLLFVMPPLLLYGTPPWFIRAILPKSFVEKVLPLVIHPLLAVIVFNVLITVYHYPAIFDYIMSDGGGGIVSNIYHLILLVSAFQMWWVLVCPLPELDRIPGIKKMAYIIVEGLLIYPVCIFIFFASKLLYKTYAQVPVVVSLFNPLEDQQFGGVIMKFIQEGTLIIALGFVIHRWYRKEM